jgi:hypothetical protein
MSEDLISVIDVANQTGKRRQHIFKVLKRLRIEPTKQRSTANRGQSIAYITADDFSRVRLALESGVASNYSGEDSGGAASDVATSETGVFYLLLLEPDHDPGRFKVGFAASLPERLRQLRCSAPFVKVVKTWPCKRLWERTAIDCVTNGSQQLHTEVFRTDAMDGVLSRCNSFFELMPKIPPSPRRV